MEKRAKKKVLIAEDDESVRGLLVNALGGEYDLMEAVDGLDALEQMRMFEFRPDLALVDIKMPRMDGFELMEKLLRIIPALPIIFITGSGDIEYIGKAFRQGAVDYLLKPFEIQELFIRIAKAIEYRPLDLDRQFLENELAERTREFHAAQLEIIQKWAETVEYRDGYTGLHIANIAHYSAMLAKAYGLEERECYFMLQAAPLHDVGKVAIPDSVLQKPGPLDANEWELMKSHTLIGYNLLKSERLKILEVASRIAISHHERWDGRGYPYGLYKEDIPVEGRIVAITDVFDALTSKRPYKDAWRFEDAANFIIKGGGTQFDPKTIEAFVGIIPEIIKKSTIH
mgnify:CR=1 FL=1